MYHSGRTRCARSARDSEDVDIVRGERRRLHKAFLRYHDANNWPFCAKRSRPWAAPT